MLASAIELFDALGHAAGLGYTWWLAANLALDRGDLDQGRLAVARLRETPSGPQTAVQRAALELRLACAKSDGGEVEQALKVLDAAAEDVNATGWPVENGPAPAYLDALHFYAGNGEPARIDGLRAQAQRYLHGVRYHRARELEESALPSS